VRGRFGERRERVASPPALESRRAYFFFFFAAFFVAKTLTSLRNSQAFCSLHRMDQSVLIGLEGVRADFTEPLVTL
jgi:hypothetical protein